MSEGRRVRYQTSRQYRVDEDRLFRTREEAEEAAKVLAQDRNKEEESRVRRKKKPNKTWAWNASYHRREIRCLRENIERHEAALSYALIASKNKEE